MPRTGNMGEEQRRTRRNQQHATIILLNIIYLRDDRSGLRHPSF